MKPTILTTAFIALLASVVDAQACSDNYTGPGCDTGVYDPDWDKDPEPEPEPTPDPEPTPEPKDPPKKPKPVKKPEPKKPAPPSLDNGFDAEDITRTRTYCLEPKKSLITDQRYLGGKYDIAPDRCCVVAVSRWDARKTCQIVWGK